MPEFAKQAEEDREKLGQSLERGETGLTEETPMMQQYREIKEEHQDKILLFHLGDFYEMFGEDAEIAARDLEITLTSRELGKGRRMPMCGIPVHSAQGYIARLLGRGHKLAVCEQLEEPQQGKKLVSRGVTRIITPGTFLDPGAMDEKRNNYLGAVLWDAPDLGLAHLDAGTGEFRVTCFPEDQGWPLLRDELTRLDMAEILYPENDLILAAWLQENFAPGVLTPRPHQEFSSSRWSEKQGAAGGSNDKEVPRTCWDAAGALCHYVEETQQVSLTHVPPPEVYSTHQFMLLDAQTRRNLELTQPLRGGQGDTSLRRVLDHTRTAMGGRKLRQWLERPLLNREAIAERQDMVERLMQDDVRRGDLQECLHQVYDLERLAGKVSLETAHARDLAALRCSLGLVPRVKSLLQDAGGCLEILGKEVDPCSDVHGLLQQALAHEVPATLREGGIVSDGYDQEVDRLRQLWRRGKEWLAELAVREKERTGIRNLKVGYNKVFGYYLEVSRTNLASVPEEYVRKQTLANAERYVTPELKEWEQEITTAQERCWAREYQLFLQIRDSVRGQVARLQAAADAVARADVATSLAQAAFENQYVRPRVDDSRVIRVQEGRHPVVERMQPRGSFVPNDIYLDEEQQRFLLITGPNMAGKSTYIRQVALIVLMAQIGSFVPAREARVGVVDRIFSRIGAADDLAAGESTFMVEMKEVAQILRHSTSRSLIILDEVGRGTSTYDGLSIAQAVAEHLLAPGKAGPRTLFATHFHELTRLAREYAGAVNLTIAVEERQGQVAFLHRIVPGYCDRSYGIHVARLAGLPPEVLQRAQDLLHAFEDPEPGEDREEGAPPTEPGAALQLDFFLDEEREVLDCLLLLEPDQMTPLQALEELYRLRARARGDS